MSDDLFSKNYFEIFNIPVSTEIDLTKVSEVYREIQKQVHPDRFVNADEQARRIAMQKTSLINQAFQTLKEPIARLQYLMSLKGVDMDSETDTSMDGVFLMEQMEFREEISEVREKEDPLDKLDVMASKIKKQLNDFMSSFESSYQNAELDAARGTVRKMQFLVKAQKEVTVLTEQLEDELF
jgi:molecular chaperone HscB